MKITKKISLFTIALLLLLLPINSAFASSSSTVNQQVNTNTISDQYVDMGDYNLFAHIEYNSSNPIRNNLPTVVFESGFGQDHTAWRYVQPTVAKVANTVSYDRGALGNSDISTAPRDAVGIATELHNMLEELNLPKPYILVGHSMGGQYIRVFQSLYPEDTKGLVTVDGTVDTFTTDIIPLFDPELQYVYENEVFTDPNLGSFSDLQASEQQAKAARAGLKNVFLTVLCAEYQVGPMSPPEDQEIKDALNPELVDPLWKTLQQGLAQESDKGKFVYVTESAHEINLYKPEVIIKEILIMMTKIKFEELIG